MEPLKPSEKRSILQNRPQAQPEDIEEYERLLSLRFTEDPDRAPPTAPSEARVTDRRAERESRLAELHLKLFGTKGAASDDEMNR